MIQWRHATFIIIILEVFQGKVDEIMQTKLLRINTLGITITILDMTHRPVFFLEAQRFGDWTLSPSSDGTYSGEPNRKS
jgi:hypothetical protein